MPKATSADGTSIAYDVVGSGPPVVIVDGAYVYRAIDTLPVELAGLALEAAAAGAPIEKLAMYEPPFIVDESRAPIPDDYVATLDGLIAAGRPGDAIAYAMTTAVGLPEEMVADIRGEPFFPLMEAIGHTAAYDARIMDGTMAGNPLPFARWAGVSATQRSFDTGSDESHEVTAEALAPELERFFA
jgi:hypothetical protein